MTGTCKYCGQTIILPDNFEGDTDLTATRACKCPGACFERDLENQRELLESRKSKAEFMIRMLFGTNDREAGMPEEALDLLKDIACLILTGSLSTATLRFETIKASVSLDKEGNVRFKRTDSIIRTGQA